MKLDLATRVLWPAFLELLERIMGGCYEFPPVLARIVEPDASMGKAPAV